MAGPGTWVLGGASTYDGATLITGGRLKDDTNNGVSSTSALTIEGTGIFDPTGYTQTVASLSDGGVNTGTLTDSGATTFTDNDSGTDTFSGTISGSLSFIMNGSGTVTLSGANTYTGSTSIQNGALSVASINKVSGGSASSSLGSHGYQRHHQPGQHYYNWQVDLHRRRRNHRPGHQPRWHHRRRYHRKRRQRRLVFSTAPAPSPPPAPAQKLSPSRVPARPPIPSRAPSSITVAQTQPPSPRLAPVSGSSRAPILTPAQPASRAASSN